LQFAIGLATTQITNISAAESRIRDADLAAETANLTRTSIAQQAGVDALTQANSGRKPSGRYSEVKLRLRPSAHTARPVRRTGFFVSG